MQQFPLFGAILFLLLIVEFSPGLPASATRLSQNTLTRSLTTSSDGNIQQDFTFLSGEESAVVTEVKPTMKQDTLLHDFENCVNLFHGSRNMSEAIWFVTHLVHRYLAAWLQDEITGKIKGKVEGWVTDAFKLFTANQTSSAIAHIVMIIGHNFHASKSKSLQQKGVDIATNISSWLVNAGLAAATGGVSAIIQSTAALASTAFSFVAEAWDSQVPPCIACLVALLMKYDGIGWQRYDILRRLHSKRAAIGEDLTTLHPDAKNFHICETYDLKGYTDNAPWAADIWNKYTSDFFTVLNMKKAIQLISAPVKTARAQYEFDSACREGMTIADCTYAEMEIVFGDVYPWKLHSYWASTHLTFQDPSKRRAKKEKAPPMTVIEKDEIYEVTQVLRGTMISSEDVIAGSTFWAFPADRVAVLEQDDTVVVVMKVEPVKPVKDQNDVEKAFWKIKRVYFNQNYLKKIKTEDVPYISAGTLTSTRSKKEIVVSWLDLTPLVKKTVEFVAIRPADGFKEADGPDVALPTHEIILEPTLGWMTCSFEEPLEHLAYEIRLFHGVPSSAQEGKSLLDPILTQIGDTMTKQATKKPKRERKYVR